METNNTEKKILRDEKQYVKSETTTPVILKIILIGLSIITVILGTIVVLDQLGKFGVPKKYREANEYLEQEQQKLENELTNMSIAYDSLKTDNDSINLLLEDQQEKIAHLLRVRAANWKKIDLYKKELGTLREIMRSYIVQIDSLNRQNKELTDENIRVRSELLVAENTNIELTKKTEQLSKTVAKASQLDAKNITVSPMNKRGNEKFKIDKIEKIKVCFTIRENTVSKPENKDVYLRLTRPDDIVLASDPNNNFEVKGDIIVYSAKRTLMYENQDIGMCIFWDRDEELIEGTYKAELYCEGALIGESSFVLK